MTTPNPFKKIEDIESGEYLRRRLNPESLQEVRRFQQADIARQAATAREEDERNPFDNTNLQIPSEKEEPKDRKLWQKALDAISFSGDLAAATFYSLNVPGGEENNRTFLERSREDQIKEGGSGIDEPIYKRIRKRRAELLNIDPNDPWGAAKFTIPFTGGSWIDYAKATRKAYLEAKEDKALKPGAGFAAEIGFDPTTYTGLGIVKGFKAARKGTKYLASKGKIADSVDAVDPDNLFKNVPFSKPKTTREAEMAMGVDEIIEPDKGLFGIFKRANDKVADNYFGKGIAAWNYTSDKLFGRTRRYLKQTPLTQAILRRNIRESDAITQGNVGAVSFKNSGRRAGATEDDMDDVFNNFLDVDGLTPQLKVNGKTLKDSDFKDVYQTLGKNFPDEFKIKTYKGKLNSADLISGMFTQPIRVIAKQEGKYIDELTALDLKKYVRFDNVPDEIIIGAAHAMGQLAFQRNLLKKAGLTVASLFQDIKVSKSVAKFLNTTEMEQIYFPHELTVLKAFDGNMKNTFEVKTGVKKTFKEIEQFQKTRNLNSEEITQAIIDGNMKFNNVSTALLLQKRQIDNIINNQKFVDEIGKIESVNILDDVNLKALDDLVNSTGPITAKSIKSLDNENTKHLYEMLSGLSKSKRITKNDVADAVGRRFSTKDSINLNDLDRLVSENKIKPKQFSNVFFRDDAQAKQIAKEFDFNPETKLWSGISTFERANNVLRTVGTGLDFSWHMLQGLVTLGAATAVNPKLFAVYGRSIKFAALAFVDKSNIAYIMSKQDPALIRRAVDDGNIRFTQDAVDAFAGTSGISSISETLKTAVEKIVPNQHLAKGINFVLNTPAAAFRGAQRAFNVSGDVIKLEGYKVFEPMIERQADEIIEKGLSKGASRDEVVKGLRKQIGSFLMKSTGGIDSAALGLPASQQAVERAFLFFSPSYTRACLSFIATAFTKGDLEGKLARRSLLGLAMFGTTTYTAMASSLGQEPKLDPTRGDFMSLRIGDSDVGFGGFYRSFLGMLSKTGDSFAEDRTFEKDRTNPILAWLKGRTSPTSSTAWDLITGSNFLGEPLETDLSSRAKYIGNKFTPFWAENVFTTDPVTGDYQWTDLNKAGLAAELIGFRSTPIDVFDERRRVRDEFADEFYGKKWNDLTNVERTLITRESEYLKTLEATSKEVSARRGTEVQGQLNNYYKESQAILKTYNSQVEEGVKMLNRGVLDPAGLRTTYLASASDEYYDSRNTLRVRTEEGDLSLVGMYWTDIAGEKETLPKIDYQDDVLDVAYQDYINAVVINPELETITGETDWYARDEAITNFKNRWEQKGIENVLDYVKARSIVAKDHPPIVAEYYAAKDYFAYYWKETERAVINDVSESDALAYKRWKLEPNETVKAEILKNYPTIRTMNSLIGGARRELRKLDKSVDGFLYRWGYTTKLENSLNKGKEDVWRYPTPFTLEEYQGSL
tara:strand:- start:2711 stop:7063 length:4353 start_codon:yes stop_codon:yes gene_type:complete